MPSYKEHAQLDEELADLLAYLLSLKGQCHEPGDVARCMCASHRSSALLSLPSAGARSRRSGSPTAANEPQNWLTYSGNYCSQRYSLLDADHAGQRQEPGAAVGVSGAGRPATGRRRRSSSTASCTSRSGRTTSSRSMRRPAACSGSIATRRPPIARLLRREQPRRRDPRRHAVHGHARRAPDRDRREERPAALEDRGRRAPSPATRSRSRRSS